MLQPWVLKVLISADFSEIFLVIRVRFFWDIAQILAYFYVFIRDFLLNWLNLLWTCRNFLLNLSGSWTENFKISRFVTLNYTNLVNPHDILPAKVAFSFTFPYIQSTLVTKSAMATFLENRVWFFVKANCTLIELGR